jgi:Tfp pilus assembly protein PilP
MNIERRTNMKNKTILMASALLIGGLLTLNNSVFADVADTTTSTILRQRPAQAGKMMPGKFGDVKHEQFGGMHKQGWNMGLDSLVTAGTITQATADKIQAYLDAEQATYKAEMEKVKAMTSDERKAYFESKKTTAPYKVDMVSTLVEKGIITQAEADAICAAQKAKQEEQMVKQQEYATTALNNLVNTNGITAEQAAKITEYMTKEHATRVAEMEKVKDMTADERAAYLKSNVGSKGSLLTSLVTDKVLTQTQADAVAKVLQAKGFQKGFGRGAGKR